MEVLSVSTVGALKDYLGGFEQPMLYRGQTKHYGGTQSPAVISSFDRLGCVPDLMLRWGYYANGALKFALGRPIDSLAFCQAVLQHYGWRSFFLDASSSPAVGAWFAAHSYKALPGIHLCEDCFEEPMLLRKPGAQYELERGHGHLYVIDVQATDRLDVGQHDLASIGLQDCRPRFHAQAAWLLGPHRGNLPIECFHSRVIAPREVFAEFAAEAGLNSTSDLFPPPEEDRVLDALLHLPWMEMKVPEGEDAIGIPAFHRTVEIPEYQDGFIKIHPPSHAFYRGQMLADIQREDGEEPPFSFRRVPAIVMLGAANPVGSRFPKLFEALKNEPIIAFEIDELIRFAETGPSYIYGKGLLVNRKKNGLVEVGDLVVDHPGMQIRGAGANRGWHYAVEADGSWTRTLHADDCPCGDDDRHERHLSALTILEDWLTSPEQFADEAV